MKQLLIVSPAFPPHPSPATHRARFLARYAKEYGWRVRVVAVDPRLYEEAPDHELRRLLPDGLEIVHTKALSARWTRHVGVSDIALRSYIPLRTAVRRLCATDRPDLLFFPGGPFYTFRIGPGVRERFGIPYVLDYTDPWVYPPNATGRSRLSKAYWSHRLATWLEPRVARDAAHILAVSDGTNDLIRGTYPDLPADRFSAIPFGFEPSDFETLRAHPRPNAYWARNDGCVHLAYVGVMPPNGFESLRALFAAVLMLRRESPEEFARVRLHFLGTTYDPHATRGIVAPVAEAMGLGDAVHEHARRIPYLDALNVLCSADVILGIGSTDHHYTASKVFPCILANRPLVGIYHEASSVCGVMRQTGAGTLVSYGDIARAESRVPEIAAALRSAIRGASPASAVRSPESLERHSARAMCAHVFGVFDRVASRSGAGERAREGAHSTREAEVMHA